MANKLKAEVLAWLEQQPHCIGYPDCDGDLVGRPHADQCPLWGKQLDGFSTLPISDLMAAFARKKLEEAGTACSRIAEHYRTSTDFNAGSVHSGMAAAKCADAIRALMGDEAESREEPDGY